MWHLARVREGAVLGTTAAWAGVPTSGVGMRVGDSCKLQNDAMVYEPAVLEDCVFVSPGAVFTNDQYPRSVSPEGWRSVSRSATVPPSERVRCRCSGRG